MPLMLNQKLCNESVIANLQSNFAAGQPYRHVLIDDFLDPFFARKLSENFPSLEQMKTKYNGINEKKAEHSDFTKLSHEFSTLKQILFDKEVLKLVEKITGIQGLQTIDDRFGFGLHQGGSGSFLDIHIDYNLHPLQKKQRRVNLLIFLNEEWRENWGGLLQLWNADVTKCVTSILPVFNRCVLFECSSIAYHGYNTIHCPPSLTRKSFYTYFFSDPEGEVNFHDTVFKPLPHESRLKKIIVTGKEGLKNGIKRALYKTGLMKFLK